MSALGVRLNSHKTSSPKNVYGVNIRTIFNNAGTAANATEASSAAAKSEAEGENKATDEDDKGGQFVI